MASARFSIGIDLGTTNSALAFAPLVGDADPEVLVVAQWESLTRLAESPTLPSFLYLPEDAVATQLRGRADDGGAWIVGRLARTRAGELPGRVVHSAKSWLCHHSADRLAPFLPWGSTDLAAEQKISPVRASALILNYLRGAWNSRFADAGFAFDDQQITVTVPASFDAAAQRLTLAAAEEAGFPDGVRLLEEPQAAFYCWLERHDPARELWDRIDRGGGQRHVLVVDIGGGTSDFSLFEISRSAASALPAIRRVAVSEHILLGGDNIDLALAHLVEPRLGGGGGGRGQLSGAQWHHLVAACRDLKETALSEVGAADEPFAVAVPGQGSGLIAGARSATVTRADIEGLLLDGFFPECRAEARPYRSQAALREWGLPFAADTAVTRHLADFLRDRPRVDAILFNGGSIEPLLLRRRVCEQIGAWQDGPAPLMLDNAEPALAVARGAARFGALLHRNSGQIAAGAARAIFLEVHRPAAAADGPAEKSLVCVLPSGAAPEQQFEIAEPALELATDRLVRFQAYSSSRHTDSRAGDILALEDGEFHALPPLQTIIRTADPSSQRTHGTVPVHLVARMNALGLLQVSCASADPASREVWPMEFNLRAQESGRATLPRGGGDNVASIEPNAAGPAVAAARNYLGGAFGRAAGKADKVTSGGILKSIEKILGPPRSSWNAPLLRALWPALNDNMQGRALSVDHEETWLILVGTLLRPGFGVLRDDLRIDDLWRIRESGSCFPGRRIKNQEDILWRRLSGGLTRERQEKLLAGEIDRIRGGRATPELVRLAGSLELVGHDVKAELIERFIDAAVTLIRGKGHSAPYLAALGHLLNRAPLYAGPETVVSPELVARAYAAFRGFNWADADLLEMHALFLRAARVVDDRGLDVPKSLRNQIATQLEKAGVPPLRTAKIKDFVAVGRADQASLYDESLPPGLILPGS